MVIIFIIIIFPVVIYLTIVNNLSTGGLVMPVAGPWGSEIDPSSDEVPAASPESPKTFKFDETTDLKAELEKVTPKVLDSDFE